MSACLVGFAGVVGSAGLSSVEVVAEPMSVLHYVGQMLLTGSLSAEVAQGGDRGQFSWVEGVPVG